jgi:protein involved in polysaccharide export with SLBB domain
MKNKFTLIIIMLLMLPMVVEAQNVFGRKNLTSVSIDQLGEDEIILFKKSFEAKNMTSSEAFKGLKKKGMSESEIRKLRLRLAQAGQVDPGEQAQILTMKLLRLQDSLKDYQKESSQLMGLERLYALDSNVFGASLFRNKNLDFAPNLTIATPPSYIVGNGDVLSLTIYGYQELNVDVPVGVDGNLNIPYSGVVNISGLTLKAAKAKIFQRLSRNGYNTLKNGKSELSITLKEIRNVDVTVVGAKVPGRYSVPGIASPYHVLHLAGGPASKGSYREVSQIRNGEIVGIIDLYDLLGSGTKSDDLRLEDGDVIFIPSYDGRVILDGEFKNPMTYEIKEGELLSSILSLSGGFSQQAFKEKIYLERVGKYGFVSYSVPKSEFDSFRLKGGDHLIADTLNDRFRNRVAISGGVQISGYYGAQKDLKLSELIQMAGGYREDGLRGSAVISTVDTLGLRSYKNVPYSLFSTTYINEGDSVLIPLNEYFERKEFLTISGEVKNPGRLKWGRGISAYDAIILANGFTGDADMDNIEISTKDKNTRSYNTKSVSVEESKQINLESGDLVSVKKIRIRDNVAFVNLSGEVKSQGSFGLKKPYENIFEIINRAGGLTDFADENGAFLIRRSEVSASDSSVIGSNNYELKDSRYFKIDTISISQKSLKGSVKFILQNMDEVFIPGKSTIVRIQGQVNAKKTVSYSALKNFNGFLRMAGGVSEEGVSGKAYVIYPNGSTRSTRKFLGYKFRPRVVPGSTIVVPQKSYSKEKSISPAELAAISGALASISTMAIAVIQLLRP